MWYMRNDHQRGALTRIIIRIIIMIIITTATSGFYFVKSTKITRKKLMWYGK